MAVTLEGASWEQWLIFRAACAHANDGSNFRPNPFVGNASHGDIRALGVPLMYSYAPVVGALTIIGNMIATAIPARKVQGTLARPSVAIVAATTWPHLKNVLFT